MKFVDFSQALQQLEQTSSRLDMTEQLAQLYQDLSQEEIRISTYLMQGRLVPEYQSLEFHLSTKLIQRALAQLMSRHQDQLEVDAAQQTDLFGAEDLLQLSTLVKKKYKQLGDLGQTAEEISQDLALEQKIDQNHLKILDVFHKLETIAHFEGEGSQDKKVLALVKLWEKLNPLSIRYVTRIIMGKLRLGFSTMTLLDALSWAIYGDKTARQELESAYNKQADVGCLAATYLAASTQAERQKLLADYTVKNGVPVVPALAQRLNSTQEVVEKMGLVIAEPKYDGLRIQIHFQLGKNIKAYTRNLDDISHMFPELAQAGKILRAESCILDGEAIGYDPETDKLLPFQKTVTRRRKHNIAAQAESVPIRFYLFDLLELNKQPLVDKPLKERQKILDNLFTENEIFYQTQGLMTAQAEELRQFHQRQLDKGLEGAIFKQVNSFYRGGRKGWRWVKMKEVAGERGQLSDALDCIVMGYYLGKGKRSEFGIGAILVGVRDETEDKIKTITKIGTGLTDEQFKLMKQKVDQVAMATQPSLYQVPKELVPDVWAAPEVVIEVAADAITDSPTHAAGVALRFPRLIKFRDDKDWENATSLAEVKQIRG